MTLIRSLIKKKKKAIAEYKTKILTTKNTTMLLKLAHPLIPPNNSSTVQKLSKLPDQKNTGVDQEFCNLLADSIQAKVKAVSDSFLSIHWVSGGCPKGPSPTTTEISSSEGIPTAIIPSFDTFNPILDTQVMMFLRRDQDRPGTLAPPQNSPAGP